MDRLPEDIPKSPEGKGTKKERKLLKQLLTYRKRRHKLEELPKEAQEEFVEVRKQVGKPHVTNAKLRSNN